MKKIRKIAIVTLSAVFILSFDGLALSQEKFPNRPVNVIVPWAPGGGGMLNFQTLQPTFEKALGVGTLIVNKVGGGGTIGWNLLANSPPDGYTIAVCNNSLLTTQYTVSTGISYKKFDPLIMTVTIPLGVAVKSDSPWKTFKEFIDYAKANPGKVTMGNSGHGATYHIGIIGIEKVTGAKFTHIPYKGSGPCMTALLGGHMDGSLIEISTLMPFVQANKLRILAVSSAQRSYVLPDVPTFKECGFELDVSAWVAYCVPKGTPKERVKVLHDALKVAVYSDAFNNYYAKQGGVVSYMGPEEMAAHWEVLHKLWKDIIDFGKLTTK